MVYRVSRGNSGTTKSNHENTKKGKTRKKRGVTRHLSLPYEDGIRRLHEKKPLRGGVIWN
jgi:hypothetical protein